MAVPGRGERHHTPARQVGRQGSARVLWPTCSPACVTQCACGVVGAEPTVPVGRHVCVCVGRKRKGVKGCSVGKPRKGCVVYGGVCGVSVTAIPPVANGMPGVFFFGHAQQACRGWVRWGQAKGVHVCPANVMVIGVKRTGWSTGDSRSMPVSAKKQRYVFGGRGRNAFRAMYRRRGSNAKRAPLHESAVGFRRSFAATQTGSKARSAQAHRCNRAVKVARCVQLCPTAHQYQRTSRQR